MARDGQVYSSTLSARRKDQILDRMICFRPPTHQASWREIMPGHMKTESYTETKGRMKPEGIVMVALVVS